MTYPPALPPWLVQAIDLAGDATVILKAGTNPYALKSDTSYNLATAPLTRIAIEAIAQQILSEEAQQVLSSTGSAEETLGGSMPVAVRADRLDSELIIRLRQAQQRTSEPAAAAAADATAALAAAQPEPDTQPEPDAKPEPGAEAGPVAESAAAVQGPIEPQPEAPVAAFRQATSAVVETAGGVPVAEIDLPLDEEDVETFLKILVPSERPRLAPPNAETAPGLDAAPADARTAVGLVESPRAREAEASPALEPALEPERAVEPESGPEFGPEPEPELGPETNLAVAPEPAGEPETAAEPEPVAIAEPEPVDPAEPERAAAEPEPALEPEPACASEPEPPAEPEPMAIHGAEAVDAGGPSPSVLCDEPDAMPVSPPPVSEPPHAAAPPVSQPALAAGPPVSESVLAAGLPSPDRSQSVPPAAVAEERNRPPIDTAAAGLADWITEGIGRGATALYLRAGKAASARIDGVVEALAPDPLPREMFERAWATMARGDEGWREAGEWTWVRDIPGTGTVRCQVFTDNQGGGFIVHLPVWPAGLDGHVPRHIRAACETGEGLVIVSAPFAADVAAMVGAVLAWCAERRSGYFVAFGAGGGLDRIAGGAFLSERVMPATDDQMTAALQAALREEPDVIVVTPGDSLPAADALARAAVGRLVIIGVVARTAAHAVEALLTHVRTDRRGVATALKAACSWRGFRRPGGRRAVIADVLIGTRAVVELIDRGDTGGLHALQACEEDGMRTIDAALARAATRRTITLHEAAAGALDRQALIRLVRREARARRAATRGGGSSALPAGPRF